MNRQEAIDVCTVMGLAWPYPEWEEARIELWVAALMEHDYESAQVAVTDAVRTRDKAPSVSWLATAIRAVERRDDMGGPRALEAPPATKETALAAIAAARESIGVRGV